MLIWTKSHLVKVTNRVHVHIILCKMYKVFFSALFYLHVHEFIPLNRGSSCTEKCLWRCDVMRGKRIQVYGFGCHRCPTGCIHVAAQGMGLIYMHVNVSCVKRYTSLIHCYHNGCQFWRLESITCACIITDSYQPMCQLLWVLWDGQLDSPTVLPVNSSHIKITCNVLSSLPLWSSCDSSLRFASMAVLSQGMIMMVQVQKLLPWLVTV